MPTGPHADGGVTYVEAGKREGIQQFAAGAMVITLGMARIFPTAIARNARTGKRAWVVHRARTGFDIGIGIRLVIPGCAADAKTVVALVGQLEFAHQVDAIGHHIAAVELGVGFVISGVVGQCVITTFGTNTQVVAQGVVPTHREVGVTEIVLSRLRLTDPDENRRQAQRRIGN